ncbi:2-amino-4-hydroxy-6-hydroxymethyldihydropteridine pyrophosphokinase [Acinetobacter gyllenbergii]|uniref:2-amino-4-hydroxy-6-hydroxymethyldihydropteridine diphosphokinase n=1 Tax=Acinetobacter gyllenbergii CIP 110306 = MTCC 11365 TaxID=1217657 RepID=A0A829HHK3_9GAMM|nr:2-amino-4-hydroxy-6-hydroxymethyldihydropteridine diphosphokinase [Acinetobacter gyllenbergii]EPF83396.1 2-amino-4-hydroxy-6-hydroxymethyldihydropteridine diphosphokinase [Acinetobacter gyllenbergii CIP 110306 = MTCC 11365]EPH35472.1 2-amino-4-hydroxy-6-hydroxymethyldihydropteridine pyrophosphokinase [Acinetobacter gyllenbergii CIP 110306 = MTCC 11365]MCU4581524.1 2-amino-4-hydroxy-6-hydroxymethyldihydropteridine diphosphokinase [Acinetobacter gyllenbergii]OBY75503.1 2-amino-4-hydroxy-6-hydr
MNATETIFALALASNLKQQQNFTFAYQQIAGLGTVEFSPIYEIPCRDGIGADYWNSACLLKSRLSVDEVTEILKKLEAQSGRVRPSHQISLDIDVIAWGETLDRMQFNPKKLPLALDVKIPLYDLWQHADLTYLQSMHYPVITM